MRAALILTLTLAGCGLDRNGLGDEPASDTGVPIGDDGVVSETGGGGGGGGDPLPAGAISYFRGATCPTGWSPYEPAKGRFVVATIGEVKTGKTTGAALASGEDRKHEHGYMLAFTLREQSFVAVSGGSNGGVASGSGVSIAGKTEPASTGLPYVQLLVCKKTAAPSAGAIPRGMHVFFESTTCPAGFAQTETTQGRIVVGLPKDAPADQTFGRSPGAIGKHFHAARAEIATKSHGIAAFSGCCADGYAKNDSYAATGNTDESATELPTIELLTCTKS